MSVRSILAALLVVSGCAAAQPQPSAPATAALVPLAPAGLAAERFPAPTRPVAGIISDSWSDEAARERLNESRQVLDLLRIGPGMTVADIGAGSGYYAVRLSRRVGPTGRVLAEDIVPEYLARLRARVAREGLRNIEVALGEPHDPRLPPASVDVALLVHMYHEIAQPFGLLANLQPALRPGGRVAIIDLDGPTERHGTPRALLACELAAVGYRQAAFHWIEGRSVYLAVFEPPAQPPVPEQITPCR